MIHILQLNVNAWLLIGAEEDQGVRAGGQNLPAHVPILQQLEGSAWQ